MRIKKQMAYLKDSSLSQIIIIIATLIMLFLGLWQIDNWYEARLLTEARATMQRRLIPYGDALTLHINQRFAQLEGLAAFAMANPTRDDLDKSFTAFATGLRAGRSDIRAIQIFPSEGSVYVYPITGNEAILGRTLNDLINDERPEIRADVQQALETRQITTSGPYELRQGGLGLLARLAVFQNDALWGITVIILDIPQLLSETGISTPPAHTEMSLIDARGRPLVGSEDILTDNPVSYEIKLPDEIWTLAMVPSEGWKSAYHESLFVFRVASLATAILLFSIIYLTINRQTKLTRAVRERTAALTESHNRYRILFESNSDALFVLDAKGQIVDVNHAACLEYGYERAEFLTMTVSDLAAPDLRDKAPVRVATALVGQTRFEWRHRRKDGTEFPVEISAQPFMLQNQSYILSSVRNISERYQAEKALRLSEERLRLSTEMAGVAVWEYDLIANQMARTANHDQLYGLEQQETWVIDTFLKATHPADREQSNAIIQEAVAPGGPDRYQFDFRVIWPDQSVHWLAVTGEIAQRDAQGHGILVRGCLMDITERKRIEQALRESETRYRLLIEHSPYAIGVHQDGVLVFVNSAAVRLLGATSEAELIGKAITEIIHPDSLESAQDRISRMLQGETGLYPTEDRYVRLDGIVVPVEVSAAPLTFGGRPAVQVIALDISERKQAEEALRKALEQLRLTVNAANVGLWDWNLLTNEVYFSPEWKRQIGYEEHEITNDFSEWQSRVHPDDVESALATVQSYLANPYPNYKNEFRFRHKDGTYRWILAQASLIYDDNQRPVRMVGVHIDITDRKIAEEALRLSEEKFSSAFHVGPAAITITRIADGKFIDANQSFCDLFEFSRDEVVGHTSTELNMWTPEERAKLIKKQLETGGLQNYELVAQSKSGRPINLLFSSKELVINGEACHLTTLIDITDRKKAEQALIESEQRYRTLFENMNTGFVLFEVVQDEQGTPVDLIILAANEGFAATTGLNIQEVIGKRLTNVLPGIENDSADWIGTYGKIAVTGEAQRFEQGSELLGYYYSIAAFQAGPKQCAVTFSDITERKLAENALQRLNEELEQRVAERTAQLEAKTHELETFNYSVSHDLKAPLRGIDGYSRLLLEDYMDQLDDDGRTFLRNIRTATDQMHQLIDDLLAYSRLERRDLSKARVNIQELIRTLLAEYTAEKQTRNIVVNVKVPCHTLATDPEGLAMALRNLIENAFKFTRDTANPVIEIGGRNTETSCIIWVRDNGIGFDMRYHDRIFEIFQRLHRAEDFAGTGIGLAIVRKAIERMGGRVWAESEVGHGATFYLEIPR